MQMGLVLQRLFFWNWDLVYSDAFEAADFGAEKERMVFILLFWSFSISIKIKLIYRFHVLLLCMQVK